jgi:nucleoside-diphosphate-sugar epimerase
MPTAFVTGSNGFVGVTLVEALLAAGWDVTAMHRFDSDITYLERLPAARVIGDVEDPASLKAVMPGGVDTVFHVAGDLSYWSRNDDRQTRTNVAGTRSVVAAALAVGAGRLVHTSSIAAYGLVTGVVDSETPSRALESGINYDRSKWLGEEEVRRGIERGLDAVIIRPGSIFGRYDRHSWAKLITLTASGRLPGVPDATLNFCHGTAVARAHISAAERGRSGEAYLLGGTPAPLIEAVQIIAELTGGKSPSRTTPTWVLGTIARVSDLASLVTGKEPDITPELVKQIRYEAIADVGKAVDELGFEIVPLADMVGEAVSWMQTEGLLTS